MLWAIIIQDYDEALKNQIDKLIHTSNLYYNVPADGSRGSWSRRPAV